MSRWAAGLALAAALGAACGGGGDDRGPATAGDAGFREAATALCTARSQAGTDVKAARATFYDRSHDALHDMARALDPVDRAASARLLEAKQQVESGFGADAAAAELAAYLQRLADVTRSGLARLSVDVPPCA